MSKCAVGCYHRYWRFPRRTLLGFSLNKRCYCVVLCIPSSAQYANRYTGQNKRRCSTPSYSGGGITPSCCIKVNAFIRIRLSTILPSTIRSITTPLTSTWLPVAGTPKKSPRWVPRQVKRLTACLLRRHLLRQSNEGQGTQRRTSLGSVLNPLDLVLGQVKDRVLRSSQQRARLLQPSFACL